MNRREFLKRLGTVPVAAAGAWAASKLVFSKTEEKAILPGGIAAAKILPNTGFLVSSGEQVIFGPGELIFTRTDAS